MFEQHIVCAPARLPQNYSVLFSSNESPLDRTSEEIEGASASACLN